MSPHIPLPQTYRNCILFCTQCKWHWTNIILYCFRNNWIFQHFLLNSFWNFTTSQQVREHNHNCIQVNPICNLFDCFVSWLFVSCVQACAAFCWKFRVQILYIGKVTFSTLDWSIPTHFANLPFVIASKMICARVDINTNPMFQYFLRILGKKYFDMCPLGTKQRIPNSLFKLSLHKRIFLTNVGKPSRPFKFQHLIWQARNIFYNNVHKTKKQKTVCSSFSATGLIRYVEMVKRIFMSSKHWLTGVNIPPANKNRQCTAIITMGIKQEQAQFTPDQNCTNTICYSNDEEILHTTKILTTAWINWERMPHHNWTSTKFQKQTRSEFSVTIKKHWQFAQAQNSSNWLNEPGEFGPSWGEKMCNPNEQDK